MHTPADSPGWVRKLFIEGGSAWQALRMSLGFCTGILVVGLIKHESAEDMITFIVGAAIGVTAVTLLWKD
jgi:hypothetical protein